MSLPALMQSGGTDLRQLLQGIADVPPIAIEGIASDSRELGPGFVFLACAGTQTHGLRFAQPALDTGVAAIVYDSATAPRPALATDVPLIAVDGLQQQLGEIANRWFDAPSAALHVTGVTGTNGKTTVAFLLAQALQLCGRRCGYAGTIGEGVDELGPGSGLTTPSCIALHRSLAEFREQGAVCAALEISSHALHQRRIDGVRFESALFTNLSRDHIDYHGDMESYFAEKRRLFVDAAPESCVINVDSEHGARLAAECADRTVAVAARAGNVPHAARYLQVRAVTADEFGSTVSFDSSWGAGEFRLSMPGRFNVDNAALVVAEVLRQGIDMAVVVDAMTAVSAPPGRMQRVEPRADAPLPAVIVDYAHTPDGLEAVLRALRPHCRGDLWCVFGCGGERDVGKRPQMGRVVVELADRPVVTSDNPRNEDPTVIIDDVLAGMPSANALVLDDRGAAIAYAIANASTNDTVVIAGKGHESEQIIGDRSIPFSDYSCALANLLKRAQKARS